MKHYIVVKLVSLPKYFAGGIIHQDIGIGFDIEWSIHKVMATKLTYEEADSLITYYQQYTSVRMQMIDTRLDYHFM